MTYPRIFNTGWTFFEDWTAQDALTDAVLGKMKWELDTIGNASTTTAGSVDGETYLRDTTAGTADGDGESYSLRDDSITLNGDGGDFAFTARIPDVAGNAVAGNNARIGLNAVVTSGDPVVGLWVDIDGGLVTLQADSANGDLAATANHPLLTSTTTMVLGTKYNFEVRWHGQNANNGPQQADLYIDGHWAASIAGVLIGNTETMEPKFVHYQDTGGAATLEFDLFGFEGASYRAK